MRLFLGCYTAGGDFFPGSGGKGIMRCEFDSGSGAFANAECVAEIDNPSYLCLADGGRSLFAVSELFDRPGWVYAFNVAGDFSLASPSFSSSHGLATCHLTVSDSHVYAASYLDGKLAVLPREGARLSAAVAVVEYPGSGPHPERQLSAHAHQAVCSPDGHWLLVCDLGSDRVRVHALDSGLPGTAAEWEVPPGAGPRHLVFHPRNPEVFVWCELEPRLLRFAFDSTSGSLSLRENSLLVGTPGLEDVGAGAAIRWHPRLDMLAVSERSGGSICLFSTVGKLAFRQRVSAGIKVPRDFCFTPDGRWLLVADQGAHAVMSFAMGADGAAAVRPTDRLALPSPACITCHP